MRASLLAFAFVTLVASRASAFENVARGAFIDGGFATSAAGDALTGEIGGESLGIRTSCDGRFVMQWDALLALKAGVLGNANPYLFLVGPRANAWVEGGWLIRHRSTFSGYLGARASGAAQLLGNPDVSRFDEINAADGTGGASARGALRISAGGARISGASSLIVALFGQEELQAPTTNIPSYAFTELGVSLRWDVERSIMLTLEGLFGVTPTSTDALRGFTDQTTRIGASGSFRKIFKNGMWLGLSLSFERDSDHIQYLGGSAFDTANAPVFASTLFYGLPLWSSK